MQAGRAASLDRCAEPLNPPGPTEVARPTLRSSAMRASATRWRPSAASAHASARRPSTFIPWRGRSTTHRWGGGRGRWRAGGRLARTRMLLAHPAWWRRATPRPSCYAKQAPSSSAAHCRKPPYVAPGASVFAPSREPCRPAKCLAPLHPPRERRSSTAWPGCRSAARAASM